MLVDDNKHRKNMMILKVEGLSRIAKHFKYFKDAVKKNEDQKKMSKKDKIVYNAMTTD